MDSNPPARRAFHPCNLLVGSAPRTHARPGYNTRAFSSQGEALSQRLSYIALNLLPLAPAVIRRLLDEAGSATEALALATRSRNARSSNEGAADCLHAATVERDRSGFPQLTGDDESSFPLQPRVPFEDNRSSAPESGTRAGAADFADGTAHAPSDEPDLLAALSSLDQEVACDDRVPTPRTGSVHNRSDGSSFAHDSSKESVRVPTSGELLARAAEEARRARAKGITILTLEDDAYPALLREIPDPPPVLYARGALDPDDEVRVAVVGSRRASCYGIAAAQFLGREIALAGITVVSGLARGIDAAAHRGALSAPGRTIAVLGSGLDAIYPREHRTLANEVAANGAVLSEYPLDAGPLPHQFPRRNRVISGLSAGVVVVEAARKSGALVTARLALEQNRELSAVPGSILSETSAGTNGLLREGVAHLVTGVDDVLAALPPVFRLRLGLPASPLDEPDGVSSARDPDGAGGAGDPGSLGGTGGPGAVEDPASGTEKSRSVISPQGARDRTREAAGRPVGAASCARPARQHRGLSPGSDEFLVAARLSIGEETTLDELLALCGLPVSRLLAALSTLELRGLAVTLPGNRVTLSSESAFDKPGHSPYR